MTSPTSEYLTGDGRLLKVADFVQLYRDCFNKAVPSKGKIQRLSDEFYSITSNFNTVDCDNLEMINTLKVYTLTTKQTLPSERCIEAVKCVSAAHEVSEIVSATSKNGRYLARLKVPSVVARDSSDSEGSKKQFLEIWERSKLIKTIDLSAIDSHGPITTDPMFSKFVWCQFGDQDKLLYVTQRKRPKFISFFKDSYSTRSVDFVGDDNMNCRLSRPLSPTDPANVSRGEEFIKREDWGESLVGVEHTIIGILDVANDCAITTIDEEGFSLGAPEWLDNGSKIVSVAYPENPRRLGLLHYNSRDSKIMVHDWQSSQNTLILEVKAEKESFHTPRVTNAGDKFFYLGTKKFGPHFRSVKLYLYDLRNRTITNLIDKRSDGNDVKEFFIRTMPRFCFSSDDKNILFVSDGRLSHNMCLYNIETSKIIKLKFPTTDISILDFQDDIILASGSKINASKTLFVGMLNSLKADNIVAWHQMEDCVHHNEVEYETYEIPTLDNSSISAILIRPNLKEIHEHSSIGNLKTLQDSQKSMLVTDPKQLPTIVLVHGGPHAAAFCSYMEAYILYARLGLQFLVINYRGSLGVDEEHVQSLCGRIGELDIDDCLHAIRFFVKEGRVDPTKLIIQGGSHGGFIACHLSCQREFKFTSAIIKNPVVNLAALYATSDIPDWCFTEALDHQHYELTMTPKKEELVKLFEKSPMSRCSEAYVPTLMILGKNDLRVNMFQGERWVDALRANGVETLCKVYQDKHDLGKPDVRADSNITSIIWILSHLPKKSGVVNHDTV